MMLNAAAIVPFTAESPYLIGAVQVYTQTWPGDQEGATRFVSSYATQRPDFRGRVALADGAIVGMGFGTRSAPGQWWHDRVAACVGYDYPALQDAWVLVELAVLAPYRGRHIGAALHDALITAQPCPRVLLSTEADNTHARQFYERRGWCYLHRGVVFKEDGLPFVVMHRERTAGSVG